MLSQQTHQSSNLISIAQSRALTETGAIAACILAAVSASLFSGLNFPEMNNVWHLPVVLDFAHSAEGPSDAYHRSFDNFVSVFWLLVRQITSEQNVHAVFIALQLAGNALLAVCIYSFLRLLTGSVVKSALISAALPFCYGLWGLTQLGYSEMFVTYATHTQFAIAACLFSMLLIIRRLPAAAGIAVAIAAAINLFMAVWTAAAIGIYLIAAERRIFTRSQLLYGLIFLAGALPVLGWSFAGGDHSAEVPVNFFSSFLAGHLYALSYPQATAQAFTLGIAAALGTLWNPARLEPVRTLGCGMMSSVAVLIVAALVPYLTSEPLFLLLHPLRFNSVVMMLAVCCAGVLLICHLPLPTRIAAFVAVGGFVMKSPVISAIGFTMLIPPSNALRRAAIIAIIGCALLSLLLPSVAPSPSVKTALSFLVLCAVISAAGWRSISEGGDAHWGIRGLVGLVGVVLCWPAAGAEDADQMFVLVSVALATLAVGGLVPRVAVGSLRSIGDLALCALAPLLIAAGLAKGYQAGFAAQRTEQQNNYAAAQRWARTETAQGSVFLATDDVGFSLFSRRPSWWEPTYGAAVLWSPGYYEVYSCRKDALERLGSNDVALKADVDYIVARQSNERQSFTGFTPAYDNPDYKIWRRTVTKAAPPLCSE